MRLPTDSQHLVIIGRNGSGKTQAAQWHLSHRNFHLMPWLIYDFKRDESLQAIPRVKEISLDEYPIKPGVYIVHPMPHELDKVEQQLWSVWKHGETGVYIDEGYMMGPNNHAFRTLLTQGRSKNIPLIVNTQRPVWMDGFVFSEASFFQVFHLQRLKDIKSVQDFVPVDLTARLPDFYSYYYDVGAPEEKNRLIVLRPVPDIGTIHATFDRRLERLRNVI